MEFTVLSGRLGRIRRGMGASWFSGNILEQGDAVIRQVWASTPSWTRGPLVDASVMEIRQKLEDAVKVLSPLPPSNVRDDLATRAAGGLRTVEAIGNAAKAGDADQAVGLTSMREDARRIQADARKLRGAVNAPALTPERPPGGASSSSQGGMPVWGWVAIAGGVLLTGGLFFMGRKR